MSGPKSVRYQPSPAELARRAEEGALRRATSRFRVLSADLEALRRVAVDTEATFATTIAVPKVPRLRARSAAEAETEIEELERMLSETRKRIHSVQQRNESERFRSYLSTLPEFDSPSGEPTSSLTSSSGDTSERESQESLVARAERYLDSLSPGAVLSDGAIQLAAAVTSATPELAKLAVRDLQAEIGRINRETKRRNEIVDRVRELDIRAGSLGNQELQREILFARADPGGITEERVTALEQWIGDEEQRTAASLARGEARAAMERALIAEGYEVLDGFETAVPQDGVLVRKPGLDYHAWRVEVSDQSIHMDVVRTTLEADPGITTTRDVEAETKMCADLPAVLSRVADTGVEVGRVRQLAPGDVPVRALPNAKPAPHRVASAQAPKERSQ